MSEPRPQYVTHDDVVAVREGRIASEVIYVSMQRAKCAQCRQVIREQARLWFVIPGLAYPRHMHVNPATCIDNIERMRAKCNPRKSSGHVIIKAQPTYTPRPINWVITLDEFHQLEQESLGLIPDQRQPRRAVACRLCAKTIEPSEGRFLFKLHDPETHWTVRQGFLHTTCVSAARKS